MSISELLLHCEETGIAPPYKVNPNTYKEIKKSIFRQFMPVYTEPEVYKTNKEEIFVISDLHISSGRNKSGVYRGTENFFSDESFSRFLDTANNKPSKAILILNGDVFDFIRTVDYPGRARKIRLSKKIKYLAKGQLLKDPPPPLDTIIKKQFSEWKKILNKVGIKKEIEELENISDKEEKYGLQTDEFKSVWKLQLIKEGHPEFFNALSKWLYMGNKLIILKGNHDLEWYWLAIRNYFRLLMAELINDCHPLMNIEDILKNIVLPNITFIDDSLLINEDFYIEHGHRYDKLTMVLECPMQNEQLNIPFGSFFNRYLLNKVELFYPFMDNVRPSGNILPILMKENFPLGVKVFFQHFPMTVRMLFKKPSRYIFFMFEKVFLYSLTIIVPALLILIIFIIPSELADKITDWINGISPQFLQDFIKGFLKGFGLIILSYLLSRLVSWLQLTEPDSLDKFAEEISKKNNFRIMTMGHTHNPGEYCFKNDTKFYNTGTWIPVVENSSAEIREDKTYTFLHLKKDKNGIYQVEPNGLLMRWDDTAGRPEIQVLLERKS